MTPNDSTVVPMPALSERAKTPRVLRLNPADNLVVAIEPILPGAIGRGRRRGFARAQGPQDGDGRDRRGRADPQVRPDHRFRHRADPPRRAHPYPQLRHAGFRPRLPLRRGRQAGARAADGRAPHLRGLQAHERQGRHAQLHRHPDQRELLGLGRALHRRGGQPLRHPRRLSRPSTASSPSSTAPAAAWPARAEGFATLQRTEWGYATHPNIGGALMVGLGCEVMQIPGLMEDYGLEDDDTFRTMTIQATGGTRKTIERGVAMIKRDAARRRRGARRETVPVSELMVALQCGGSDGYSGITANPALGPACRPAGRAGRHRRARRDAGDLRRRAPADPPRRDPRGRREAGRAHQLVGGLHRPQRRQDGQQPLARQQGRRADDDPREVAGRRRQGRHHDAARRLPLRRAGRRERGFVFMDSPGYDPASVTGQVASGCNLVGLHHRPRLGLRLQAVAVDQARHQQRHVPAPGRGHGHQLRRHPRRRHRSRRRAARSSRR